MKKGVFSVRARPLEDGAGQLRAPEVAVVERALDLVDRLKQKKPEEGPEKAEIAQALIDLVDLFDHSDRLKNAISAVSAIRRSQSTLAAADKEIYRYRFSEFHSSAQRSPHTSK